MCELEPLLASISWTLAGTDCDNSGPGFLVQMQSPAHVLAIEHAPQPVNLIHWPKERVLAVNRCMLALDHILDFSDRFTRDIAHALDMLRNKHQPVRINVAPLLPHSPDFAAKLLGSAPWIWVDFPDPKTPHWRDLCQRMDWPAGLDRSTYVEFCESARARFGSERVGVGRDDFAGVFRRNPMARSQPT